MLYSYYRNSCAHAALGGNNFPFTEYTEWQQSCHGAPKDLNATPAEKPWNGPDSEEEWAGLFWSKTLMCANVNKIDEMVIRLEAYMSVEPPWMGSSWGHFHLSHKKKIKDHSLVFAGGVIIREFKNKMIKILTEVVLSVMKPSAQGTEPLLL